ncbi:3-oxoacyl-ACP synthase [Pseudomonas fluorescens]|uniref:3-oxoacyl-[acyl-carrier-protein] synthase III C-terminal domain-containing protein n=1 Tax=Pseudomonas fluorescens TaxID=294 RepID=UPI001930AA5C|nr:3-oxoacyl-[acyl-carrier-protein] synthase III C-terminal domain-containing protein [Pseudomonas fluorescens]MBD8089051.1 3-oxoacyl-ACP synthase [Pseudomonas fluorescens]
MKILASAIELGSTVVNSTVIDAQQGLEPGTCEKQFLIKQRYYAGEGQTSDQMAAQAISKALDQAGLSIEDFDCLISASGTPSQVLPYDAASVYRHLGSTRRLHTFDVCMTCLSFVQALDVAKLYLDSGRYRRIIVVSSEVASCGLSTKQLESAVIFGDGAAAFLFERQDDVSHGLKAKGISFDVKSMRFETVAEAYDFCTIAAGGSTRHIRDVQTSEQLEQYRDDCVFHMDGKKLYRFVAKELRGFVDDHLASQGLSLDDIDLVVPHQASGHGLKHCQRLLGVEDSRFLNIFENYGNQVSVSIPLAIHKAIESGRILPGQRLLLVGTSAGMSYGSAIIEVGEWA